jgi:hypothetical protein
MKIPKVISLILALSLIGVVAAGCSKKAATTTTTIQRVTVGTDTVTVEATYTGCDNGNGKLAGKIHEVTTI